jgi:hypothetical protein
MEPDDLLCSRNARPQKALVGRAQWKINQPPSPEITSELGGSIEGRLDDLLCSGNARSLNILAWAYGSSREIDCEAIGGQGG